MIDEGDVSPDEAEGLASIYDGLDRYFAAVSGEEKPGHDQASFEAQAGDVLVLATDGLEVLDATALVRRCGDELTELAPALLRDAMQAGSDDNITVVAIRFGEDA